MSYDEQRDFLGNVVTHHGALEAWNAGATPGDTRADIENKIHLKGALDKLSRQGLLSQPSGAPVARAFGMLCIGFVVVLGVALSYPWWKQLRDPAAMWERYSVSRSIADRRQHFSDFAPIEAWPQNIQEMVARRSSRTLDEIVREIPVKTVMSQKKQEELGAELWFRYAAHGSKANAAFSELRERTIKTKDGIWKIEYLNTLPEKFLNGRCKKGLEIACIDAAKVSASVTFHTLYLRAYERNTMAYAIKLLPTTGPLASKPAIVELRKKLEAYY